MFSFQIAELNRKESKLRANSQFQRVDSLLQEFTNKFQPIKSNQVAVSQQTQQAQQNIQSKLFYFTTYINLLVRLPLYSNASKHLLEKFLYFSFYF